MDKVVKQNLERAENRLEAAQILLDNEKFVDSINRAYYSMYHSTMALLRTKSVSPKTHKGLIGEFGKKFVKNGQVNKKYSKMLSHAESLRESADYGIKPEIKPEDATKILKNAKKFLEMAKEQVLE